MPGKRKHEEKDESDSTDTLSEESSTDSLLPEKSESRYKKAWEDFIAHIRQYAQYPKRVEGKTPRVPTEDAYVLYMRYLKKTQKASTISSTFSMLGTQHKAKYGNCLKEKYPSIATIASGRASGKR